MNENSKTLDRAIRDHEIAMEKAADGQRPDDWRQSADFYIQVALAEAASRQAAALERIANSLEREVQHMDADATRIDLGRVDRDFYG